MEPTAWIFSEFIAANTASAVLVSSNPTNILIASTFKLNFITDFTKWTILPSIIPGIINYGILLFMFRNKIPETMIPLTEDPWNKVRDRVGAYFFSILMLVAIVVLVGTSFVPNEVVHVWMVTAPAGILAFLYDVGNDWFFPQRRKKAEEKAIADDAADVNSTKMASAASLGGPLDSDCERIEQPMLPAGEYDANNPVATSKAERNSAASGLERNEEHEKIIDDSWNLYDGILQLARRFPGTTDTVGRLPIPLLPFAMCEFIMVRGLAQRGWIHVFAEGFINACSTPLKTVFFMGVVCAAFLCPLAGTNIGATIILVEILRDPAFMESAAVRANPRIMSAAVYAVALGSNIGAFSYTFAGSLAGLLWRGLLLDKGIRVSQLKFAVVNFGPLVMQITVACAIIYGQLYWFRSSVITTS
jgi:Na+/H+ antiporter NhaD/arsenite permease-like protein